MKLRRLISNAVKGTISEKQYGPIRKKGYIGKTMGVMAGGPFNEKIKTITRVSGVEFNEVVNRLETALNTNGKWKLKHHFTIKIEKAVAAVFTKK